MGGCCGKRKQSKPQQNGLKPATVEMDTTTSAAPSALTSASTQDFTYTTTNPDPTPASDTDQSFPGIDSGGPARRDPLRDPLRDPNRDPNPDHPSPPPVIDLWPTPQDSFKPTPLPYNHTIALTP